MEDSLIRVKECAHRLGVPINRVASWAKYNYVVLYGSGKNKVYVDWNEVLSNPLIRRVYDAFMLELARTANDPLVKKPKYKAPRQCEPLFVE